MESKKIENRKDFKDFINYLHSSVLNFEQLEKDDMVEVYLGAMAFVSEVAGNISYSPIYKEDLELMINISNGYFTCDDLAQQIEKSPRWVSAKVLKLTNLGFLYTIKEKKVHYFRLTPYGTKELTKYITNPNSILYTT